MSELPPLEEVCERVDDPSGSGRIRWQCPSCRWWHLQPAPRFVGRCRFSTTEVREWTHDGGGGRAALILAAAHVEAEHPERWRELVLEAA